MARHEQRDSGPMARRRDVLRTIGVGGAVALAGCDGDGSGGTPTAEDDSVDFLLTTSESGGYGQVGDLERNGFELAIDHLNDGGGFVDQVFDELSGDGVLGRTVQFNVEDTEYDEETARTVASRELEENDYAMVTGGVSGDATYAVHEVTSDAGVIYMAGTAPVPGIVSEQCSPTTFREGPHAASIIDGLDQILREQFRDTATYYQLSSSAAEGTALEEAITAHFDREFTPEWSEINTMQVRPGSTGLKDELETIAGASPDVVILNLFGLDAVNGVRAAKEILDEDTGLVVPLIDDSLGHTIGSDLEGIIGTIPWDAGIDSGLSVTYSDEYVTSFGRTAGGEGRSGSGTAHVIYVQTLLYAAAAERAGTFETEAVANELEGMEYDVGLGVQEMRACDHQATRPLPVVRGLDSQTADGNRLEIMRMSRDPLGPCDQPPASDCSF